jgi:hypothetical protein
VDHKLRQLIDTLRMLAIQADAEETGLLKAGQLIDQHFQSIRDAFAGASRLVPASQRRFWDGVQEFVSNRLPNA